MGDFTPGVARAKAAGYKIDVRPYVGTGDEQVQQSLDVIAQKIRDGRLDPDIRGWAGDVLIAAGKPATRRGKVQALLDAFRDSTMYVADPVGAEYIASGSATACLRPGLCVRARDCDDGTVFMGSVIASIGIPVMVLKQSFGYGRQEHVLVEAQMEDGTWIPVDPSTELAAGDKVPASGEIRIDPMDVPSSSGTTGPEIVTLGGLAGVPSSARDLHEVNGVWTERRYGQWWVHEVGMGWVPVGAGDACCAACAEGKGKPCADSAPALAAPPHPAPAGKQWVRSDDGPWTLEDLGTGKASPDDDEPCSACEVYAARMRAEGKLARYGVSGPGAVTVMRPFAVLRRFGLGDAAPTDTPGTTPIPTPIPAARGGVGIATVLVLTAAVATAGGVGLALGRKDARSKRRRAA